MARIQYSGNVDNSDSFSVQDMESVTQTYNDTVDAIDFILQYTGRANQAAIQKELEYCGLTSLQHVKRYPYNNLISCVGMAADLHKRIGMGIRDQFSQISTEKILEAIYRYESDYSMRTYGISQLCWGFQTDVILAFAKLYKEVNEFRTKYKHVAGLRQALAETDSFLQHTLNIIGEPEASWFKKPLSLTSVFKIRDKMSDNDTPIFPVHIYNDIMRFNAVKERILQNKREYSRKKHYDKIFNELDTIDNRNIELVESNREMAKRIAELERENTELRASNTDLASKNTKLTAQNDELGRQINSFKRGIIGKVLFSRAQKRK